MAEHKREEKEEQILLEAVEALRASVGLSASSAALGPDQEKECDGAVVLKDGKRSWKYFVEVRANLTSQSLGVAIADVTKLVRKYGNAALVTSYINPVQAEKLRDHGIEFFDGAGNAFFNRDGLYVLVSGRKSRERFGPAAERVRAFNSAGLRMIFTLLCLPGSEQETYRDLAAKSGISLGAVSQFMQDLENLGYVVDYGARRRRLLKKKELLKRWCAAYPEQLRPKLLVGRFRAGAGEGWWKKLNLEQHEALWGGEVAAELVTNYLRAQTVTLYSETNLPDLQAKHSMRRDAAGNIEIIKRFWSFDGWEGKEKGVVPPVLIYADLVATADERNIEAAEMVYDRYIDRLVG